MRRVARTLSRGDIVLDLGAHTGIAAIEFSHCAGRVYAFEPHPDIFAALQRNTRAYPRIVPVRKAVSDTTGTAQLFFEPPARPGFFEGSTLVTTKSNLSYANAHEVETVALAEFILSLDRDVALIKMDVEGAEYRILSALIETPAIARVREIHVEDHCDRVAGLAEERAAFEARAAALGVLDRFDFGWP